MEAKIKTLLRVSSQPPQQQAANSSSTQQDENLLIASLLLTRIASPLTIQQLFQEFPLLINFVQRLLVNYYTSPAYKDEENKDTAVACGGSESELESESYARVGIRLLNLLYHPDRTKSDEEENSSKPQEHLLQLHRILLHRLSILQKQIDLPSTSTAAISWNNEMDVEILQATISILHSLSFSPSTTSNQVHNDNGDLTTGATVAQDAMNEVISTLPRIVLQTCQCHLLLSSGGGDADDRPMKNKAVDNNDEGDSNKNNTTTARGLVTTTIKSILHDDDGDDDDDDKNKKGKKRNDRYFDTIKLFFQYHLHYITTTATMDINITPQFYLDAINFITTAPSASSSSSINDSETTTIPRDVLLVIHNFILTTLSQDSSSNNNNDNNNSMKILLGEKGMISSIQKLILFGISSILSETSSDECPSQPTTTTKTTATTETIVTSMMIRTKSFHLIVCLTDYYTGFHWTQTQDMEKEDSKKNESSSSSSPSVLGEGSILCAILRFTVGEIRMILGRIVDNYNHNDIDDLDISSSSPNHLQKGKMIDEYAIVPLLQDCMYIVLGILHMMLQIADDDDNDEKRITKRDIVAFNADAILHIRHSLEDTLDAVVQFLLENHHKEMSRQVFIVQEDEEEEGKNTEGMLIWDQCAFECCRFLGAYLSEISIWDYANHNDNDDDDDAGGTGDGDGAGGTNMSSSGMMESNPVHTNTVSSESLLKAVASALSICKKNHGTIGPSHRQETNMPSSQDCVILFPCIIAILTNCLDADNAESNMEQVSLTNLHLVQNGSLEKTASEIKQDLQQLLLQCDEKMHHSNAQIGDIHEKVSWCDLILNTLREFRAFL